MNVLMMRRLCSPFPFVPLSTALRFDLEVSFGGMVDIGFPFRLLVQLLWYEGDSGREGRKG